MEYRRDQGKDHEPKIRDRHQTLQRSNNGVWTIGNLEYDDGGPLKHDCYAYPSDGLCLNYSPLGQGGDSEFAGGEIWSKTEGPWFIYLNSTGSTITDTHQAAQALYKDAEGCPSQSRSLDYRNRLCLWVNGHLADRGPADPGRDFANKVGKLHFYAVSNRRLRACDFRNGRMRRGALEVQPFRKAWV